MLNQIGWVEIKRLLTCFLRLVDYNHGALPFDLLFDDLKIPTFVTKVDKSLNLALEVFCRFVGEAFKLGCVRPSALKVLRMRRLLKVSSASVGAPPNAAVCIAREMSSAKVFISLDNVKGMALR